MAARKKKSKAAKSGSKPATKKSATSSATRKPAKKGSMKSAGTKSASKSSAKSGTAKRSTKASKGSATKSSTKGKTSAPDTVRTRIHGFAAKALRDGPAAMRELPGVTRSVIADVAKGLDEAVPQSDRNVLRQVVDSMTDAAVVTAHSVREAFDDSTARGAQFIRKDAAKTVRDLRDLETNFIGALDNARKSLSGAARDELDSIVKHAKKAGTRVGPAAQAALKAADGRLTELGVESAKAGLRVTRRAVGGVLDGASGFLQALGESVSGRGR